MERQDSVVANRTQSLYPRWSSCSFLGFNYFEQISSQFEEYLSDALIPENSCLLNEVCYPLQNIDTFYRSPWSKAEYDEEFLAKEANKVNEHISAICFNTFPFDEIEKNFVDNISPEIHDSSESINFEEENLHITREKIRDYKDFQCLEVPFVSNSVLKLKVNDIFFQDLLKHLSVMELNDVIEIENPISLKDLEECINIPLTPENNELLPKEYEDFKELVLPEITSDDIEFEKSSIMLQHKNIDLSQSTQESNLEKIYPFKRKFTENLDSEFSFSSSTLQHENIDLRQSILEPNFKEGYFSFKRKSKVNLNKTSNSCFTSKINDFSEQDVDACIFDHISCFGGNSNIDSPPFDYVNKENIPVQSLPLDANAETVTTQPKILTCSQSHLGSNNTIEHYSKSTDGHTRKYTSYIAIQNDERLTTNSKESTDDHAKSHKIIQDYTESSSLNFESTNQPTKIDRSLINYKSDCSNISLNLKNQALDKNCNSETLEDCFKNIDDENYSDIYFEDFNESKNMNVKNIEKSSPLVENSTSCHSSEANLQKNCIPKSDSTSTLFEKLSNLQLNKSLQTSHINSFYYKDAKIETNSDKSKKCSAHRKDIPTCHKSANEDKNEVFGKTQNSKQLNLLALWFLRQKGKCMWEDDFNSSPSFNPNQEFSSNSCRSMDHHLEQATENYVLSSKETSQSSAFEKEEKHQLFSAEDIVITFPDDYLELAILHETVAVHFVQKLVCWEGFQFSLDLTLLDISLDRMRFLLNQELKNCKDRNFSPLQGGIKHSNYVKLLVLHGILKSLNCLINFGAKLCLSTLLEFTKKYSGFPKDCFKDLTTKIKNFVQKIPTTESIHPKIKGLITYLQEKYYFCKDNMIPFKVLIILKQHLNFFFSEFEAFMKTLLPEIGISLILESSLLQQDSPNFRVNKDDIYIAWSSSLSNDIAWRNLILVVEYETDNSACWKNICVKQNVAHICIKVNQLQLKTLNEIIKLPVSKDYFSGSSAELQKVVFIATSSICSEYNLKSIVASMQNAVLYERSYKMYLPHLHFADIAVDCNSGLVVIELISFFNDDFLEQIVDKMSSLHRKFETCWIIIQDDLSNMNLGKAFLNKIKNSFYTFYMALKMENNRSFKLKFLHAKTSDEVSKWINCILSMSHKRFSNDFNSYPVHSLSLDMKQAELFLVSFPSLNPINASFILSSGCSLLDVMNLKLNELCSQYSYISERFLRHFHSHIQEKFYSSQNPNEAIQDEILNNPPTSFAASYSTKYNPFDMLLDSDSDGHTNSLKELNFETDIYVTNKPIKSRCSFKNLDILTENYNANIVHTNNTAKTRHCLKNLDVEAENSVNVVHANKVTKSKHSCKQLAVGTNNYDTNIFYANKAQKSSHSFDNHSPVSKSWSPDDYSEMSLEDIDKCYRELQLESDVHSLNDTDNLVSTFSGNFDSMFAKSQCALHSSDERMDDDEMDVDLIASQNTPKSPIPEIQCCFLDKQPSQPRSNKIKRKVTFSCDDDYSSPQENRGKSPTEYLSQFMYKKKRKLLNNGSKQPKSMKKVQDSILSKSFRVQKGQSSKTVFKQTLLQKALLSQEVLPWQEPICSSKSKMCQSSVPQLNCFKTVHVDDMPNEYSEKLDLTCMSQDNVTLTPKQGHKLSYEKVPGSEGQTRLVFH